MIPPGVKHRLHKLNEITLDGLRAINRDQSIAIIPVGMVEEHGPHLPLGTDTYAVDALVLALSSWLLETDPDLHILLTPTIPFGTDPVDRRRPELFREAGSLWISAATLKAVISDLTGHLVRYGFRAVFPVAFHGGAENSLALADVCAAMRQSFPGLVMFEPAGYVMAGAELDVQPGLATLLGRPLTHAEELVLRGSIHASMFETSLMLHLRPDLVSYQYKKLRSIEWNSIYSMPDWPGYVGAAPARADAEIGSAVLRWRGVRAAAVIRRAMLGEDISLLPRHPTWMDDNAENETPADIRSVTGSFEIDWDATPRSAMSKTEFLSGSQDDDHPDEPG